MRKYEAPKIDVIEFEAMDIIQTSGGLNGNDSTDVGGTGNVFPAVPGNGSKSIESNY